MTNTIPSFPARWAGSSGAYPNQGDVRGEILHQPAALVGGAGGPDDAAALPVEQELEPLAQRLMVLYEHETHMHAGGSIGIVSQNPSDRKQRRTVGPSNAAPAARDRTAV